MSGPAPMYINDAKSPRRRRAAQAKTSNCTFSLMMMISMMTMMCLCGAHACFPLFLQELKPASKPGSRRGSFNPNNKEDGGDGSEVII